MARQSLPPGRRQHAEGGKLTGSRRAGRPAVRRAVIALGAILLVFAGATARLIIWPSPGPLPERLDAVVLLAGPGDRLPVALELARARRVPVLLVSQGNHGYGGLCPAAASVPGTRIICFDPVPANTRGESEFAARLAQRDGWHSITLVSTSDQDFRARMLMRRCYAGPVYAVTAPLPADRWPYAVAYGWGALFKAVLLDRSC